MRASPLLLRLQRGERRTDARDSTRMTFQSASFSDAHLPRRPSLLVMRSVFSVTTTDGGTNAAYGFNFQYVTTAEFFLRYLRQNLDKVASIALHIESASLAETPENDDIVDFAIEQDEAIHTKAQVKASRHGRELIPSDAKKVFEKLNDDKRPTSD
jgi:hypothetical protein